MAIQKQIWITDLDRNQYKDIEWVGLGRNDDDKVDYKTVNLSESGAKPNVVMDRAVVPAQMVQRTDFPEKYDMHEFTSDPTLIRDIDEIEVSYDKRQDVLSDHKQTMAERIADYAASVYATGVTVVDTTGPEREAGGSLTGERHSLVSADLRRAFTMLNRRKISMVGRYLILDADTWSDILADPELKSRDYTEKVDIEKGTIGTLFGFDVYSTAELGFYTPGTNVAIAPGAVVPLNAERFCLVVHRDYVRRANGETKVYENIDDATLYGSVFSAMKRFGCTHRYLDKRGVVAIRQKTPV